jgi:succinate dehydrogenase/fumarate reductase-like Fe-S protein
MRTLLALQQPGAMQQREYPPNDDWIDAELAGNIFRGLQSIRFRSKQGHGVNASCESGICGHCFNLP